MWISPKPMVDGFVKIFDEFRNGCDEKAIRYRHSYNQRVQLNRWGKKVEKAILKNHDNLVTFMESVGVE